MNKCQRCAVPQLHQLLCLARPQDQPQFCPQQVGLNTCNIIMLIPYSLLSHQFLSEFVVFDHPRFGVIPCIASIHSIAAGEEIFVRCRTKLWNELSKVSFKIYFPRYGYDLDYCPDWYLQAWESGKILQILNCLQTQNVLQLMASWQTRIYGSNSLDN